MLPLHAIVACGVLVAIAAQPLPKVSVDSTFPGYGHAVIIDGKWVELGKQTTTDFGSPNRLGNAGNTWVSAPVRGVEHWVRLDWDQAVELNRVTLWWAEPRWYSRAFRIEVLCDQSWVPVLGPEKWLAATEQKTVVTVRPIKVRSLRVLQSAGGGPDQGFLALQEVQAANLPGAAEGIAGARVLYADEVAAMEPLPLQPNLAWLHVGQPGAVEVLGLRPGGQAQPAPGLNDGNTHEAALESGVAILRWPIQHVLDGAQVWFAGKPPQASQVRLEVDDGEGWRPLEPLSTARSEQGRWVRLTLEPVATRGLRLRIEEGMAPVAELEVRRYIPPGPHVWPERLVKDNRFERELLASGREPSLAELSTVALSMTPARALLGLKDDPREVAIAWDGTVLSAWPLEFRFFFGNKWGTLAKYRDTVTRSLVNGWAPMTVVQGRVGDLKVTETAFVSFAGPRRTRPALFVRIELLNLAHKAMPAKVRVAIQGTAGQAVTKNGTVSLRGKLVLVAPPEATAPERPDVLEIALTLKPGETRSLDFVQPHGQPPSVADAAAYRAAGYGPAQAEFHRYWNEVLAQAARVEVPEERVNAMYRGVLAQLFINADGDIMPYGAAPGAYDGKLYGIEESFAMFALAWAGYAADVERYMDATYLTRDFLKKVPDYKNYEHRHQQYRNGLQPHFAIRLYRITRNRPWIQKHLPLIRECAEWTIAQRRKTMAGDGPPQHGPLSSSAKDGQRPLHWGLLPKWSYGGDIAELQCYALYANYCCWQGLKDTAWLMEDLGDAQAANRYRLEAEEYGKCIERAALGNIRRDRAPPFLPLQLYATQPVGHDYDQLFYGCLLDLGALEPDSQVLRTITEYMEGTNLTFCLLPRFRRDVGPGGLDGLYGLGYILTKLKQGRVDEFLLGFYGYMAFNLERNTWAARETNLIYASDLHVRPSYPVPDVSDPLPCAAAVALVLLRNMLVMEAPGGELKLLAGAPRAWFTDGKTVRLEGMPTDYGKVACAVKSELRQGRIEAAISGPDRGPCRQIALRLPHPERKPLRRAIVNGQVWHDFDPENSVVRLRPTGGQWKVIAEF